MICDPQFAKDLDNFLLIDRCQGLSRRSLNALTVAKGPAARVVPTAVDPV